MSLGKLPGMKGLASGSQEKRRFKSELSVDMISPPLGDFRHTMHVGRGGDVFGDTSFLSSYGGLRQPGSPDSTSSSKAGFFTRAFHHVRKNSVARPRGGSRDTSSPPPDVSPIIKNAISLPQLNLDASNGCLQSVLFPTSVSSMDNTHQSYGEIRFLCEQQHLLLLAFVRSLYQNLVFQSLLFFFFLENIKCKTETRVKILQLH